MARLQEILSIDPELAAELNGMSKAGVPLPRAAASGVHREMVKAVIEPLPRSRDAKRPLTEAVIKTYGRPVLLVRDGKLELPESAVIRQRILQAKAAIETRIPAVGRVEFEDTEEMYYFGTGWVIAENTIITNAHVAEQFARGSKGKYAYLRDPTYGELRAQIDFREEHRGDNEFEVIFDKVMFIGNQHDQPDLAIITVKKHAGLPDPIPLADKNAKKGDNVNIIGYPAADDRGATDVMGKAIFKNIYNVKRVAPGRVLDQDGAWAFKHDASTLGGNSGSVVLDDQGRAVGLHYAGELLKANYAVRIETLKDWMRKLKVQVRVADTPPQPAKPAPAIATKEAAPKNTSGYAADFIGKKFPVPLPSLANVKADLAKPATGDVLTYTNFSVAMCKSRRLCFFSAANIDGEQRIKIVGGRESWKLDDRLSKQLQIKDECYGRETDKKFSRGHMTRREDPVWGPHANDANDDTFFVANACPQIQPFNAGLWLGLEDYVLQNTDKSNIRVCVFTGPIFDAKAKEQLARKRVTIPAGPLTLAFAKQHKLTLDPEYFGVRVPVHFWKIVAFIHDNTGKLAACGYTMSQENMLPDKEFVFGRYQTFQESIAFIEERTGLSFGKLRSLDTYKPDRENIRLPLISFEQIKL
jgi:endonuclease G, mitochondrial